MSTVHETEAVAPVAQDVAEVDDADFAPMSPAAAVVVDRRKPRVFSRAAITGLLFALLGAAAHVLLNGAVVTWAGSAEAYVQVVGVVAPALGFFFAMIGLGQRRYAGRGFAVLGLLLAVAGLIAAQYFWAYVIGVVAGM